MRHSWREEFVPVTIVGGGARGKLLIAEGAEKIRRDRGEKRLQKLPIS
jgi:hypothetical protein